MYQLTDFNFILIAMAVAILFVYLLTTRIDEKKENIMIISYDTSNNFVRCYDWTSRPIKKLSGVMNKELFNKIIENSKLIDDKYQRTGTRVYIWDGLTNSFVAYSVLLTPKIQEMLCSKILDK